GSLYRDHDRRRVQGDAGERIHGEAAGLVLIDRGDDGDPGDELPVHLFHHIGVWPGMRRVHGQWSCPTAMMPRAVRSERRSQVTNSSAMRSPSKCANVAPLTDTWRLVAGTPRNDCSWLPSLCQRTAARSPSTTISSMVVTRSGNADRVAMIDALNSVASCPGP